MPVVSMIVSVSATGAGIVPLGAIVPVGNTSGWALPSSGQIKDGYVLCDGQSFPSGSNPAFSGTAPNLTDDRFLQGSSSVAGTGGANTKTLTTTELPAHTHSINHDHGAVSTSTAGSHSHGTNIYTNNILGGPLGPFPNASLVDISSVIQTSMAGDHTHSVDLPNFTGASGSAGSGTGFDIRPKYFNVVYLMRVV